MAEWTSRADENIRLTMESTDLVSVRERERERKRERERDRETDIQTERLSKRHKRRVASILDIYVFWSPVGFHSWLERLYLDSSSK